MNQSEVILARYRRVEKEADELGRLIGVRRLKPSEQGKLTEYTAGLVGSDEVIGPNGEKMAVPHRLPLVIAASVCLIDESPIPFAKSRAELDAIYDRLDQEGIAAASRAIARLQADMPAITDQKAEAKN